MTVLDDAFDLYLSRITPTATQMDAAVRGHQAIRSFLEGDEYFGSHVQTTFLNGSYARKTVINPIRDVDIIVVVGPRWLEASPDKAMESLRHKLSQSYDGRRTRRRRRAVQVRLSVVDFDVLLAVAPQGMRQPLRIPDRHSRQWITTHPKLQLELCTELNKATGGTYVRLVRLLKAWSLARVSPLSRPKSFALECLIYHIVFERPGGFIGTLSDAFLNFQGMVADKNLGTSWFFSTAAQVPDPALPGVNVADAWSHSSVQAFKEKVRLALRRADAASRARSDEAELKGWQSVFGDPFPSIWAVERYLRDRT